MSGPLDWPDISVVMRLSDDKARLRAAIEQAIKDLDDSHQPWWPLDAHKAKGLVPLGCGLCWPKDGAWPCASAGVADDLRAALDPQEASDE